MRWGWGVGVEEGSSKRSRAAKRVAMRKKTRRADEEEKGERQLNSSIISPDPSSPTPPPPLLSLLLLSRFLHSKQLTTPEKETGVTLPACLPACLLSYRFCPSSFGRRSRLSSFAKLRGEIVKWPDVFRTFLFSSLSLSLSFFPFTYRSISSFARVTHKLSLPLSLSLSLSQATRYFYRFPGEVSAFAVMIKLFSPARNNAARSADP